MKFISILLFTLSLTISSGQQNPPSKSVEIKFDALGKNDQVVNLDISYTISPNQEISTACPFETIEDLEFGLITPAVRSYFREKLRELDSAEILEIGQIVNIEEVNDAINRPFTFNNQEGQCDLKLSSIEIKGIKYFK